MEAVSKGVMYEAKGKTVCTAGIDGDPCNADLQTELAAFLMAAGEYSYYRCGGWSHSDTTWYPVHEKKLGVPLRLLARMVCGGDPLLQVLMSHLTKAKVADLTRLNTEIKTLEKEVAANQECCNVRERQLKMC